MLKAIIWRMKRTPCTGRINLEISTVILRHFLTSMDANNFILVAPEGDAGVQSDITALLVVDGVDFKSILVSAEEAGLLTSVAGGACAHDRGLGEDA